MAETQLGPEKMLESPAVSVARLNGRPRAAVSGRHKSVVVYVARTTSLAETIRLLRETAEGLARSLPRMPDE